MTLEQALDEVMPSITLETMTDDQFNEFTNALPPYILDDINKNHISWQEAIEMYSHLIPN